MMQRIITSTLLALSLTLGVTACSDDVNDSDPEVAEREVAYMKFTADHHASGVLMAEVCVESAVHAELRELCRNEIEIQSRQIEQLQTWLRAWYGITYEPEITPAQREMAEHLASLSGAEFEIKFMQHFSSHHSVIVDRSRSVITAGTVHAELREMAAMIIQVQSESIAHMQIWLCIWHEVSR